MRVVDAVSTDTVQRLVELLDQAKRGELVGVAVGAIYKRSNFETFVTGEASRNPVFTMGVVALMHGQLSTRMQHLRQRL